MNKDWILRFNSNPPDFVPHSGEFVADVSALGLHYVTGFIATEGDHSFKFYEPWKSEYFKDASSKRGKVIYKEYCAQCHGAKGEGDGPAASGLKPKPAVHAKMAMAQFPMDYLYNVVYYGGKAVGKSHYMPYWGLTVGEQGVADVIGHGFAGPPLLPGGVILIQRCEELQQLITAERCGSHDGATSEGHGATRRRQWRNDRPRVRGSL